MREFCLGDRVILKRRTTQGYLIRKGEIVEIDVYNVSPYTVKYVDDYGESKTRWVKLSEMSLDVKSNRESILVDLGIIEETPWWVSDF
jgi:hypothetical protein